MTEEELSSIGLIMKLTKEAKYYLGETCLGNINETAQWIADNCTDEDKLDSNMYLKTIEKFTIPEK